MEKKLSIVTGSEGPEHDPYHFEEFICTIGNAKTTIHLGLGISVRHAGQSTNHGDDLDAAWAHFGRKTGISSEHSFRIQYDDPDDMPSACPRCGKGEEHWESHAGYIGEEMIICECGQHIWNEPVTLAMIE